MDKTEIKDEMIEVETIQIAVNDKLHRIQTIQDNLQKRIDILKKQVDKQ